MKQLCILFTLVVISCATREKPVDNVEISESTSTTPVAATEEAASSAPVIPDSLLSKVIPDLEGIDTLYNILAREKLLAGEFDSVSIITEVLIETDNVSGKRQLMAALIQTYEEYDYTTIVHNTLAVFDPAAGTELVSFLRLGDSQSQQLTVEKVKVNAMPVASGKHAAAIHFLSSQEGAGDHASRSDVVVVYGLVEGNVAPIFEYAAETWDYVSDETSSWYEVTVTGELTVGDLNSVDMPTFTLEITRDETQSIEPEEDGEADEDEEQDEQVDDESQNQPEENRTRIERYSFDGRTYVLTE